MPNEFFKTAKLSDIIKENFRSNYCSNNRSSMPRKLGNLLRVDDSNSTNSKNNTVFDFLQNK